MATPSVTDPWATPPENFHSLLFERVNAANNEARYYYLAYMPTLFGRAVVRVYGHKGGQQRILTTPFATLDKAWPAIRTHIRTRLRHGYRIVKLVADRPGVDKSLISN